MQDTKKIRQVMRQGRRAWGKAVKQTKFTGEKPSMLLYLGISMIALFKDLLDLVGIGSLPAIGTVITFCLTFLIWMLFLLFDKSGGGSKTNRALARGLILTFVGLAEGLIFGLNLLPLETATIVVLYFMAKHAYKKAEKKHKEETEKENKKKSTHNSHAYA
jgi:Na+-transporting methylmalonyl-CoA/oxaloacetate decarboxylase gamma subunit